MIYIDSTFRFYDDSKDLDTFPELRPPSNAIPLTEQEVAEITQDISRWRWHPTENKPYKVPDCPALYWKTVDGVIVEMTPEEKQAVDDEIAARLAIKEAARIAEQARIDRKLADIAANLPSWEEYRAELQLLIDDAQAADTIVKLRRVVVDLAQRIRKDGKILYWLAKDIAT